MDTIWLEDFLAILSEGGFSRAAERRAVSQSAFSRRIRSLEDWVGATLFDRDTHSIRLTAAGERFRPAAEEILRVLEAGRRDALSAAQAATDTLLFAATHALSLTFFPAWLRKLETESPSMATVQLTADTMVGCERLMIEGRAQFLLCHHHSAASTRLTNDGFRSIGLGTDVMVPVVAPSLVSDSILTRGPFLAYTSESGMGRILTAAWEEAGKNPPTEPAFSSHLATVLAAMARDGRGLVWSPLSLVHPDIEAGKLIKVGNQSDEVPIEIRLFRPRARQSLTAERFWDRLVQMQSSANAVFPI
jgi:DNA-binding transcriptional LysR family regulator